MSNNRDKRALLLALASVGLWSTVAVAFKLALRETDPLDLVALATFFSWLSLGLSLIFTQKYRQKSESHRSGIPPAPVMLRKDLILAGLLGLLNPLAYYWVLFQAYHRLPAQAAQPLNYTWPIFLAILAAPMKGQKPTGRDLTGLLISLVGVGLISWRRGTGSETLNPTGIALALGSGIIWAFYWLAGSRLRIDGGLRLFVGFSSALIVLGIIWWYRGASIPLSPGGWASVMWVGLFEMGITFLLWNKALASTDRPARIGNLVYLGPFISLFWIHLFLGETIRPATVAGLAVIVTGIMAGQRRSPGISID